MWVPVVGSGKNATALGQRNRPEYSGRTKVCHQDDMLFNCAVQVPHRALRTRPLCIPLLVVRPAVYCYVSRPRKRGVGGAEEARTPDPLLAKEVLSQLSYGPRSGLLEVGGQRLELVFRLLTSRFPPPGMVGHSGLEPETSVLSGLRSNQLS